MAPKLVQSWGRGPTSEEISLPLPPGHPKTSPHSRRQEPQKAAHEARGTDRGCVPTESHPLRPARRPPGLQLGPIARPCPTVMYAARFLTRPTAGVGPADVSTSLGTVTRRPATGERHGAAWAWRQLAGAGGCAGQSTGQGASGSACSGTWSTSNGVWPGPSDLPVHRLPWCFSRGPTTTSVCGSRRIGKVTRHSSPEPEGRLASVTDAAPSASANRLPSPSASTQVFNLRMPQGPSQPRPHPPTCGQ